MKTYRKSIIVITLGPSNQDPTSPFLVNSGPWNPDHTDQIDQSVYRLKWTHLAMVNVKNKPEDVLWLRRSFYQGVGPPVVPSPYSPGHQISRASMDPLDQEVQGILPV